jgi:SPOR domain
MDMAQGFGSFGNTFGDPRRSRRRRRKRSSARRYVAAAVGAAVAIAALVGIEGWSDRASAVLDGIGVPGGRLSAIGEARQDPTAPRPDAAQDVARTGALISEDPDGASGGDPMAPATLSDAAQAPAVAPAGEDAPVATAPATEASPPIVNGTEGTSIGRWATAPRAAATANPTAPAARVFLQLSSFNDKKRADIAAAALSRRAAEALGGAVLQVVRGSVNDRPVWRVRVGPLADPAEARALCASLGGRERECLVVRS